MIVRRYTLDLYCDNTTSFQDKIHEYQEFPHTYAGETRQECARQAREDGWIINFAKGTAICPKCSKKKQGNR